MLDNIQRHQVLVIRILAKLYSTHPRTTAIDHSTPRLTDEASDLLGKITDEEAHGAIVWVHRNHLILGELKESLPIGAPPRAFISDAQLSPTTLRVLSDRHNPFNSRYGDVILNALGAENEAGIAANICANLF